MKGFLLKLKPVGAFIDKYSQTYYALLLYSLIAMLGWVLMWTDVSLIIFGLIAMALALSCKSFNGMIGVFGIFLFSIISHGYNEIAFTAVTFVGFSLMLLSFVVFLVKNRVKPRFSANFYGICALNFVFMAGGLFNYKAGSVLTSLMFVGVAIAITAIYFVLSNTFTAEGKQFYARTFMTAGLIICLQMIICIFKQSDINSALVNKELWLGWGITNNAGVFLFVAICCAIYLACGSKRPSLYIAAAFVLAVINILTFSRASLLIFMLIFVPLSVILMLKSVNRKEAIISYGAMMALGILGIVLLLVFVVPDFGIVWGRGLSGNGRLALYDEAIFAFRRNYIFGVGFSYVPRGESGNVIYYFHNTYLQFLASGGVVGLIAVFMHKIAQYRPYVFRGVFKGEPFMLISLIIILATSFYGLMDITIWSQHYIIPLLPLMAISEDIAKNQHPEPVATNNKKLKSIGEVKIKIATLIIAAVSFSLMVVSVYGAGIKFVLTLTDSVIAICVFVLLYIGREGFRTLGYICLLNVPLKYLRFSKSRKSKFLYGHNAAPMYARDMMLVELYPVFMTAVAPMVCATIMGNVYMMLMVAVVFACSAGDLLLAFSLLRAPDRIVQDHPTMSAYYINYPEESPAAVDVADAADATDVADAEAIG